MRVREGDTFIKLVVESLEVLSKFFIALNVLSQYP